MNQKAPDSEQSNEETLNEKDACAAVSDYFTSKFDYLPPSFGELFLSSPEMQDFLKSVLNLLRLSKEGPLSTESIENIELGIRQLIFSQSYIQNLMKSQNSSNSAMDSPSKSINADQLDQIEINRLRSSFLKLKGNYALLQEEANGYQNKISNLQSQIDVLNEEKKNAKKTSLQQKKESNEEISQIKAKTGEITEKYQDELTKNKLLTGVIEGLKSQLKMAQEETDESIKQSKKLEAKLDEKKKLIYKLKVEMKKQNILFEQTATNANTSNPDLESTIAELNANNSEILKLKAQLDSRAHDIAESKQIIKDREATIDAHRKRLDAQSETILKNNKAIDELKKQNQILKDAIDQNDIRVKEMNDLLDSRANELINLRDLLTKISEILSDDYNIEKLTDIPDIIEDLLSIQNDQTDQKLNAQAFSFIDGLTRFIDTVLMSNKADANLLVGPSPILGDRELLAQISANINRCKETFEDTYGKDPKENRMFDSLLSAKEHFAEDTSNCEFASLVIICAANEKLRRLCIQQKKQIEEYQRIIPADKYNEFRKLLNSYEKVNLQIFKEKTDDRLSLLSSFLNHITTFYHQMKIDVLPTLSIDCDFVDIPTNIVDFFNELNQSYSVKLSQTNSTKSLTQSDSEDVNLTATRSAKLARDTNAKSTINQAENKINKLEAQNRKLEELVKKLLKKVQTLTAEKDSFKEKFDEIVAKQTTQENNLSEINERFLEAEEQERKTQIENERLQALIEQRQQNFQARLDKLLQAERENYAKELERNEKMWQEEKQSLLDKIESKTAKFNYQRKADHELIEFLEKQLRSQSPSKSNADGVNSPKRDRLAANIQSNDFNENNDHVEFVNSIIKELQKVVHIKGEWNQQKALSGVRKIVAVISNGDKKK